MRNFEREIMGLTYEKLRSCEEFLEVSGDLRLISLRDLRLLAVGQPHIRICN